MIRFGEWLPDQSDLENQGVTIAKNVLPEVDGYREIPAGVAFSSNALDARPQGLFADTDDNGTTRIFAGDATKLYELVAGAWVDRSGATYNALVNGFWEFVKWGNTVIATNGVDAIQAVTMGGLAFADLAATAPQAKHIAVVRNFVVVGNTYDTTDGKKPQRVWWSGLGNSASWPVPGSAAANAVQSGLQDLPQANGGWVQSIIGGEFGLIFQERAITRMTYIGGPAVFQFDVVDKSHGLLATRAIANIGRLVFFLSEDGFFMFDGVQKTPIGDGKVDDYFFANVSTTYIGRTVAAVNPRKKLVFFNYANSGSSDGTPDRQLIYNWGANRWSHAEITDHYMAQTFGRWTTLEGLDAFFASVDNVTPSMDDPLWNSGTSILSGFNATFFLVDYNGTGMNATIETGELESKGARSLITGVRPVIEGGTTTVQIGTRDLQTGSESFVSAATPHARTGVAPFRSEGRYHRVRFNITGGFTRASGYDLMAKPAGKA